VARHGHDQHAGAVSGEMFDSLCVFVFIMSKNDHGYFQF